uniref:Uncharacterized protein n=1 Tax=Acrobeloides nanus TaxID=290746 RepID=A0A914EQ60_9BILA
MAKINGDGNQVEAKQESTTTESGESMEEDFALFTTSDGSRKKRIPVSNGVVNEHTLRSSFGIVNSATISIYRNLANGEYSLI